MFRFSHRVTTLQCLAGLCAVLGLAAPAPASALACTHTITNSTRVIDARTYTPRIGPGSVICLQAGSWRNIDLKNVAGSSSSPVTLQNIGGQVVFSGTDDFAINLMNSRYIRITGTGAAGVTYGFKVKGNYTAGLRTGNRSSDMEIDHVEVADANYGALMHTNANCADGSDVDFDYDGDGKKQYDRDDVVTQSNFTLRNVHLHDLYVHDTSHAGLYVGTNRIVVSSSGMGPSSNCAVAPTNPLNPKTVGVRIHHVRLVNTGRDSIEVKGGATDCVISDNVVVNNAMTSTRTDQMGAIDVQLLTQCDIFRNTITGGNGPGVKAYGVRGGTIANNVIYDVGNSSLFNSGATQAAAIMVGDPGDIASSGSVLIANNTIVSPRSYGIAIGHRKAAFTVQNNLVVAAPTGMLSIGGSSVTQSNNLNLSTASQASFKSASDYRLNGNSPAVDKGTTVSLVRSDMDGVSRPQGTAYDIGAYEYRSGGGSGSSSSSSSGGSGSGGGGATLLKNTDFSQGMTYWNKGSGGYATVVVGVTRGNNVLKLDPQGAAWSEVGQSLPAQQGDKYMIEGDILIGDGDDLHNGNAHLNVRYFDANGNRLGTDVFAATPDVRTTHGAWVHYTSAVVTAPAGTAMVKARAIVEGDNYNNSAGTPPQGPAFFDDVVLTKK